MGITDELRKYTEKQIKWLDMTKVHYRKLFSIADRIDAEHERTKQDLIDANNQMEQLCECSIELPKDADGVPIHIGDVMESKGSDFLFDEDSFEVRAMRHDEGGWEVYDRLGDRYAPSLLRHHHKPTVEDVLLEACKAYHGLIVEGMSDFAHDMPAPSEIISEYAAKLRLADEGEEQ